MGHAGATAVIAGIALGTLGLGLAPGNASARDLNGVFGIGGARTLGGVQGIDAVYGIGKIQLNGTLDIFYHNPSCNDGSSCPESGLDIALAIGALYPLISGESAALSIGGRLDIDAVKGLDSAISLEAPLRVEWFITPHLSLHGEVGIILELRPENGSPGAAGTIPLSNKGTAFVLFGTNVTGGGGFTFFFE